MCGPDDPVCVVYTTLFALLWAVALILNVFNTSLLGRTVQLRATWSNVLLLALSSSDCFVVVFGGTVTLVALFYTALLRDVLVLCYIQGFLLNSSTSFSYFVVAFIGVDRYLAICHPFWYNRKILARPPLKLIGLALLLLGSGAVLFSLIPFATVPYYGPLQPPVVCWIAFNYSSGAIQDTPAAAVYITMTLVVLCIVIFCTVNVCVKLYLEFRNHIKRVESVARMTEANRRQSDAQSNFAKLAAAISMVFFMSTIPHMVRLHSNWVCL